MNSQVRCDRRWALGLGQGGIVIALLCCAAAASAGPDAEARKIMAGVYRQDTSHDTSIQASFEVFGKQGPGARKKFSYRRIGSPGQSRTLVVFTDPEDIRGVALLSISEPGVAERQYIYVPATQRVRSVVLQQRSARFIGTDFSFEDIADRALDDFAYRRLGDGETIDGHRTYKIEATPVDAARSQYHHVHYWVAKDVPVILRARMFDARDQVLRELNASQVERVSGIWGTRRREMRSVQEGTRTVLSIEEVKFNRNLDARLFTPEALQALRGDAPDK